MTEWSRGWRRILRNVVTKAPEDLARFGLTHVTMPQVKWLGSGNNGAAFLLPDGERVLKWTWDRAEGGLALRLLREGPIAGLPEVFYVGKIRTATPALPLHYLIVMEAALHPANRIEKAEVNHLNEMMLGAADVDETSTFVLDLASAVRFIKGDEFLTPWEALYIASEELDVHSENVGLVKRDGRTMLVIVDLGQWDSMEHVDVRLAKNARARRDRAREKRLVPEAQHLIEEWVAAMSAAGVGNVRWNVAYEALESGDANVYEDLRNAIQSLRERAEQRARWDAEEAEQATWDAQAEEVDPYQSFRQLDRRLEGKRVWLYHGTSTALLPAILEDGLSHEKTPLDRETTRGFVYLTAMPANDGRGDAIFYARRAAGRFGGEPVVLRVIVPWDDLYLDEDDVDIATGRYQFRYAGAIPPEWIREVGDERR